MLRELYYRLLYFPDVRNANGLMRFGERCINSLLGRAKRRSASARKSTLRIEVEKETIEEYLKNVQRNRLLEDNEYFGIRKKVQTGTLFVAGIFLTECLLSYYSTLVLINGTDLDITLLRWLLATALTLGAITTSEKLLESCLPQRLHNEDSAVGRSVPVIFLWSLLLGLVLLGVVAVAEARVRDIEGNRTGTIVYFGFIALSTVLPLIAGTIAWEIARYYDSYKQTRRYRTVLRRLDRLTSKVGQNVQVEKESFDTMLTIYWNHYNDFRSFKENYDLRHRTNGSNGEALSYDFEEFKRVAEIRYGAVRQDRSPVVHTGAPQKKLLYLTQSIADASHAAGNAVTAQHAEEVIPERSTETAEMPEEPPVSSSFVMAGFQSPRQAANHRPKRFPKRRRKEK